MLKTLFIAILCLFSFCFNGQVPFTSANILTTIGTDFTMYSAISQEPGDPGMGQIWDFSEMLYNNTTPAEIVETGSPSPNAVYPGANQIFSYNFEEFYEYYAISDTTFEFHGQFQQGGVEMFYTDPNTIARLPINYEDGFEDEYVMNYSVPGATSQANGTYNAVVDGYGTLKLPWADLEAYRITAQVSQSEEIENINGEFTAYFNGVYTFWFAPGFPGPVMSIRQGTITIPEFNIEENQFSTIYMGDFNFVGVDEVEIVNDLKVFPNPTADYCNISFSKSSAEPVTIEIYDITGRKLKAISNNGGGTGDFHHRVDVRDIPAGYYLLKLRSHKGEQGLKIVVR